MQLGGPISHGWGDFSCETSLVLLQEFTSFFVMGRAEPTNSSSSPSDTSPIGQIDRGPVRGRCGSLLKMNETPREKGHPRAGAQDKETITKTVGYDFYTRGRVCGSSQTHNRELTFYGVIQYSSATDSFACLLKP